MKFIEFLLATLIVLVIVGLPVSCTMALLNDDNNFGGKYEIVDTVVSREYIDRCGKTTCHYVEFRYGNMLTTIDASDNYNNIPLGLHVPMYLITKYSDNGSVYKQRLEFIK